MIPLSYFPALNASLNAASAVCLVLGLVFILRKRIGAHTACMVAALGFSIVFLACYLYYHFHHGMTRFPETGPRAFYLALLGSHLTLAMTLPVLAPITVILGFKRQDERHKKIARWTFPIWLYVSLTGVAVYVMLYHLYPSH